MKIGCPRSPMLNGTAWIWRPSAMFSGPTVWPLDLDGKSEMTLTGLLVSETAQTAW